MAFLDIMPLSPGHLLVTTRTHHEKISDVGEEEARELGVWLPRLSRVLANATGVWDWNIVQNNGTAHSIINVTVQLESYKESNADFGATGAAAAQVVPHVHFHIIPRPSLTPELRNKSFTMFGKGQRSERDDDEAAALARSLRVELAKEMHRIQREKL
jgi:diadenosine tetraphosphate (Ap4A) HIT family hydrolase